MGSRRGRLNWSNLDVHISDDVINKQHHFSIPCSVSLTPTENAIEEETVRLPSPPPATKKSWMPKKDVGEMQVERFVGNYMLTAAEQVAIDQKYQHPLKPVEHASASCRSKPMRISNRLSSVQNTTLSIRTSQLSVGQHLLNVFVCHVESYSRVYIMFGDDYNRATKLFQDMNNCDELIQTRRTAYEPKEKDLVAIYHEKRWFRGQCLDCTSADINVMCIDSGAIVTCSPNDLRRLPDIFRMSPRCCIECSLSGLPTTICMNSIPDAIHAECYELLYKDRYEAIVTRLESTNRPTVVLYYGDINVNDRLFAILKLI